MYTYFISYALNDCYIPHSTFRNCVITLDTPLNSKKKLRELERQIEKKEHISGVDIYIISIFLLKVE